MHIDVPTLILSNLLISTFLGAAMLFSRANQKTYAGFGLWTVSIFCFATSYASILLRGIIPTGLSIFFVNFCFAVGLMFRFDGTLLFLKGKRLPLPFYATSILVVVVIFFYFYLVQDDIILRSLIISSFSLFTLLPAAYLFFSHQQGHRNNLHRLVGIFHMTAAGLLMTRSLFWLFYPEYGLLGSSAFHALYFGGILVLDIGIVSGFIMMNSQRLEEELILSRQSLDQTLQELQQTLSEVKILSGLLPICAFCKKVRDDSGYWQQIERYIRDRSDADFSHSVCPECIKEHYPDLADEVLKGNHRGPLPG